MNSFCEFCMKKAQHGKRAVEVQQRHIVACRIIIFISISFRLSFFIFILFYFTFFFLFFLLSPLNFSNKLHKAILLFCLLGVYTANHLRHISGASLLNTENETFSMLLFFSFHLIVFVRVYYLFVISFALTIHNLFFSFFVLFIKFYVLFLFCSSLSLQFSFHFSTSYSIHFFLFLFFLLFCARVLLCKIYI